MQYQPIEADNSLSDFEITHNEPIDIDDTNPTEMSELDIEVISVLIPEGIEGPEEISEWFNSSSSVIKAKLFLYEKLSECNPSEIDSAFKFLCYVQRGFTDICCGDGPTLAKLKESERRTKGILRRVTRFLMISDDGTNSGEAPPDFGHEDLNRLTSIIFALERRINQRFDKIDTRFDKIDTRFDKIDRKLDGLRSVLVNQFKSEGGPLESGLAYDEIANKDGKYPSEENMQALCSLSQIDGFNGSVLNTYLQFYSLPTSGTVPQRKNRLKYWIGVPHSQVTVTREEFGIYR